MDRVSLTGQAVAVIRAAIVRPSTPEGDADAQRLLCAGMLIKPPESLRPRIEARTRFIDQRVLAALAGGVRQVVICGAGYDDRALRFRESGVRYFELDHAGTQADKAARLATVPGTGPVLVQADFSRDDVDALLDAAGHDASQPTLFICEGLLVYLGYADCLRLLAVLATRAASGSELVVTLAVHADGLDTELVLTSANAARRTGRTEPWRTILPRADHLAMLAEAGWQVQDCRDASGLGATAVNGRRSLFVVAQGGQPADS
jgi:methyltransferase (TIGR00027 family)